MSDFKIVFLCRPHGQHAVILTEDASKYNVENRSERNDPGPIVSGSRQIYLTFPAESTFTEEDVSAYFGFVNFHINEQVIYKHMLVIVMYKQLLPSILVELSVRLKMSESHANKSGCSDL